MTTESMPNLTPHVYAAIATVTRAMAVKGIGKGRRNTQQGYSFRGIDDFYNALAPELAAARLCILPRCLLRELVERRSAKDAALFYITVTMEFDFVSAEDGSKHVVGPFYGEAMDSGDKATNKAMSAAYKYCVMQTFAIPVEGQTVDSEVDSHEVLPELDPVLTAQFEGAESLDVLAALWNSMQRDQRAGYAGVKDAAKARLSKPSLAEQG